VATLATAAVALAIGSVAPSLEAPLRPVRGAWLDAFDRACAESSRAEPEDVIREMLVALRGAGGLSSASPELWTHAPPRVTTVDRAGYMHERDAELPEALVFAALGEPERTLRADVLEALEVRRPELRILSQWMVDRSALVATVIAYGGDVEGLLLIPRAGRGDAPTLEEVRALKDVADCMAAACRARAAHARMLARAQAARELAERAEEQVERTLHERALDVGRNALAATRLARPATVGGYSAASRMALEALERRTSVGAPIAVVAPSGVDPVPYLARAHLAGARGESPLVLVDATSAREHDLTRWSSPLASPLALADRGTLVLLDGAALPTDVQQLVARALAEKRAPWERPEPLDVQLALTAVMTPEELSSQMRLDASLALRLGDAFSSPVALPRLRDRVEDMRAVITDRLAREGLRVLGRPVGIEQAAYARLIEYPFPGEDAELAAIVQRLVSRCTGDVVRASDVNALRLGGRRGAASGHASSARRKSPMSA
jgi:transcriptional regulator with GAF, ATPase, and Fis domain